MCHGGTFRYTRCKHHVIEIREPCRKQLFKAGLTGVLTLCVPSAFTKLLFRPGQFHGGEEPPYPFTYLGQDGFCELCCRRDKARQRSTNQHVPTADMKLPKTRAFPGPSPLFHVKAYTTTFYHLLGLVGIGGNNGNNGNMGPSPKITFQGFLCRVDWKDFRRQTSHTTAGRWEGTLTAAEVLQKLNCASGCTVQDFCTISNAIKRREDCYRDVFEPRGMPHEAYMMVRSAVQDWLDNGLGAHKDQKVGREPAAAVQPAQVQPLAGPAKQDEMLLAAQQTPSNIETRHTIDGSQSSPEVPAAMPSMQHQVDPVAGSQDARGTKRPFDEMRSESLQSIGPEAVSQQPQNGDNMPSQAAVGQTTLQTHIASVECGQSASSQRPRPRPQCPPPVFITKTLVDQALPQNHIALGGRGQSTSLGRPRPRRSQPHFGPALHAEENSRSPDSASAPGTPMGLATVHQSATRQRSVPHSPPATFQLMLGPNFVESQSQTDRGQSASSEASIEPTLCDHDSSPQSSSQSCAMQSPHSQPALPLSSAVWPTEQNGWHTIEEARLFTPGGLAVEVKVIYESDLFVNNAERQAAVQWLANVANKFQRATPKTYDSAYWAYRIANFTENFRNQSARYHADPYKRGCGIGMRLVDLARPMIAPEPRPEDYRPVPVSSQGIFVGTDQSLPFQPSSGQLAATQARTSQAPSPQEPLPQTPVLQSPAVRPPSPHDAAPQVSSHVSAPRFSSPQAPWTERRFSQTHFPQTQPSQAPSPRLGPFIVQEEDNVLANDHTASEGLRGPTPSIEAPTALLELRIEPMQERGFTSFPQSAVEATAPSSQESTMRRLIGAAIPPSNPSLQAHIESAQAALIQSPAYSGVLAISAPETLSKAAHKDVERSPLSSVSPSKSPAEVRSERAQENNCEQRPSCVSTSGPAPGTHSKIAQKNLFGQSPSSISPFADSQQLQVEVNQEGAVWHPQESMTLNNAASEPGTAVVEQNFLQSVPKSPSSASVSSAALDRLGQDSMQQSQNSIVLEDLPHEVDAPVVQELRSVLASALSASVS